MKPYYYVYNYGNQAPRIKHSTLEKAQKEAERLAVKHPGLCFEILQCVGFSSTSKASTFWADGCGPPQQTTQESNDEWYYLKAGEVIRDGDEFLDVDENWVPATFGCRIRKQDVGYFRRKIK